MQEYINMLDSNLKELSFNKSDNKITIEVESTKEELACPYCGCRSSEG